MTVMLGPSLDLQQVIVAALRGDADVQSLIGAPPRINPQQTTEWPGSFIQIGEGQELPDLAECIDGSQVYIDIHIWSQKDQSFSDVKKIAATIWQCLSNATLTLTQNTLVSLERDTMRYLRDDGTTLHGLMTLVALTEPA